MTPERLRALLADVAAGTATIDDAERRLAWVPVEEAPGRLTWDRDLAVLDSLPVEELV